MLRLSLVIIMAQLLAVSSRPAERPSDTSEVQNYWISSHPYYPPELAFDGRTWKEERLDWQFVKQVSSWAFLDRLEHHRFYRFGDHPLHDGPVWVVAVDDSGLVSRLNDTVQFNSILRTENVSLASPEEAESLAQDFLLCRHPRWGGIEREVVLALRTIAIAEDIEFASDEQRTRQIPLIKRHVALADPKVHRLTSSYVYTLFTWDYSRTISRHEVEIQDSGELVYRKVVLLEDVGRERSAFH